MDHYTTLSQGTGALRPGGRDFLTCVAAHGKDHPDAADTYNNMTGVHAGFLQLIARVAGSLQLPAHDVGPTDSA